MGLGLGLLFGGPRFLVKGGRAGLGVRFKGAGSGWVDGLCSTDLNT